MRCLLHLLPQLRPLHCDPTSPMLQRLLARVGLPVLLGLKPMHRQHQQMQGHVQCEWAVLLLLFLTWRLLYAQR